MIEPDGKGGWRRKISTKFKSLFDPIKEGDYPLVDDYFAKEDEVKRLKEENEKLKEKLNGKNK
jgi:hypothetical protein